MKLVDSPSEYVRLTAISGLGILGATQQMPLLEQIYNTSRNWSDRGMALKAIGDLNTVQSQAFLAKELDKWKAGDKEKQARWNTEIIELYL